jgi:tetratricopeptide (TPR) repeat protein
MKPSNHPSADQTRHEAKIGEAGQQRKAMSSPAPSHAEPPLDRLNTLAALYSQGRLEEVVRQAAAAIAEFPNAVALHNILGTAKAGLGDLDGAIASFGKAVEVKPDFVEAHNNLGLALHRRGRFEEAIASFENALQVKPDFAEAHNNLGAALKAQGRLEEAIESFNKALQIEPTHAEAHYNLGAAFQVQDRLEDAIASFSKAVEIKPGFVEAHSHLCGVYEKQNKLADLEKALERATRNCGKDNSNILFRLAQLASRKDQSEEALGYLERVQIEKLQPSQRQNYFSLFGKVCDKLGRFGEAFSAFVKQNELAMASVEAKRLNADRCLNWILSHKAAWAASARPAWVNSKEGSTPKSPAFLVGFPRSGTTLLDTILRSHLQNTVVEEKPIVGALVEVMSRALGHRPTIQDLDKLTEADFRSLRDIYFKELKKYLDQADDTKLIVDKLPLNIIHVDIIHRIFPDAKLIFALRHPCDCVLSCFMQTFKLNDAMANFASLDQSAKFYAAVMDLWSEYQQKLSLNVHVLRYEDLIRDFACTCQSLIGFLGLEWDDNVYNYQKTAMDRSSIRTPSYNQVTQPLYKQASGRWMNYREQMQPVLPVLQPWIAAFGY